MSAVPSYVVFQIAEMTFVLDCAHTLELVQEFEDAPTRMPQSHDHVIGAVNHRGAVTSIVDFRKLMGMRSYAEEVADMSEFIAQREKDHVTWLEDLRHSARTGAPFTKATDPKLCAFGKWYESLRGDDRALNKLTNGSTVLKHIFAAFDTPHKKIHGIAEAVLAHSKSGRLDEASQIIEETWNRELATMRELFKNFFREFSQVFKPMAIIVSSGESRFAIHVDQIRSVMSIPDSDFAPLPALACDEARNFGDQAAMIDGVPFVQINPEMLWKHVRTELETVAA